MTKEEFANLIKENIDIVVTLKQNLNNIQKEINLHLNFNPKAFAEEEIEELEYLLNELNDGLYHLMD